MSRISQPGMPQGMLQGLILLGGGLLVTLTAQFGLDSFADSSQLGHWLQHGLLFAGGCAVGTSLVQLYRRAAQQLA